MRKFFVLALLCFASTESYGQGELREVLARYAPVFHAIVGVDAVGTWDCSPEESGDQMYPLDDCIRVGLSSKEGLANVLEVFPDGLELDGYPVQFFYNDPNIDTSVVVHN